MAEKDYYQPIKSYLERLLREQGCEFHLEITAAKKFSNTLKRGVASHRNIVFHFLRDAAPDIAGFIKGKYSVDFVVVEIKDQKLKLDNIYQARKYAELLDAKYAILVSTVEIPEEIKRLQQSVYALLSLPASKTLALARFDRETNALVDWFPKNPFDNVR